MKSASEWASEIEAAVASKFSTPMCEEILKPLICAVQADAIRAAAEWLAKNADKTPDTIERLTLRLASQDILVLVPKS